LASRRAGRSGCPIHLTLPRYRIDDLISAMQPPPEAGERFRKAMSRL
jgi:hypothetical protein